MIGIEVLVVVIEGDALIVAFVAVACEIDNSVVATTSVETAGSVVDATVAGEFETDFWTIKVEDDTSFDVELTGKVDGVEYIADVDVMYVEITLDDDDAASVDFIVEVSKVQDVLFIAAVLVL